MWVYNHYVNWRGDVDHWNMGCAMYVEEIPGGFRYHCNDGDPDDDLNDLVFELTVIGVEEEPSSKRRTRKQSKS